MVSEICAWRDGHTDALIAILCTPSGGGEVKATRSPAKARFGRPYGKNGRIGGHIGETGTRNTAATQKINFLTPVSYSLLQTLFL